MRYAILIILIALMGSCIENGVFERTVTFPDHEWRSTDSALVTFEIKDTTSYYNLFFVLRHTDAYHYNNIWIRIKTKGPTDAVNSADLIDLPLATQEKWNGTGMDDIFEQRILLTKNPVRFNKPGTYTFYVEHAMRENPLESVLNAGIRLEKTTTP